MVQKMEQEQDRYKRSFLFTESKQKLQRTIKRFFLSSTLRQLIAAKNISYYLNPVEKAEAV